MNKTFIEALKAQNSENRNFFISMAKKSTDFSEWHLKQFISAHNFWDYPTEKKIEYLVKRINKKYDAELYEKIQRVDLLGVSGEIEKIIINVEWTKSRTWGANPTANVCVDFASGMRETYAGTASGCGYDKESAAIASALNQCDAFIALLFEVEKNDPDGKIYGYSNSKKRYFPHLSGGVGVSCYPSVFAAAGFEWNKTGWGKMFDCYSITKK